MYTKKVAIIAVPVALLIVSLFFFQTSFSERRLRIQKEKALSESLSKLGEKDAQINELKDKRDEMERALNEKIASLETSVNDLKTQNVALETSQKSQEESIRSLTEKITALEKQKEALMDDNLDKSQEVTDLEKKIAELESGRSELFDKIKDLEGKKTEPAKKERPARVVNELRYEAPPVIDAARLGKILVQKSTGKSAQVQHVNKIYQFIIINAGSHDGLRSGSVINVIHGDQIIGKALVQKLKPDLSAAVLLPEWSTATVEVGDFVSQF